MSGRIRWISEEARRKILSVPHFKDSHYAGWDLDRMLASYIHGYVDQAVKLMAERRLSTVADIGTGYGWLAIALALRTDARIIALDFDPRRLVAAQEIAAIMGVGDRIEWRVGAVGSLPFEDREVDLVFCLEVVEHVGVESAVMRDLARITKDVLIVTTPNGLLPVVFHDTELPFCHWLPLPLRDAYAALFGRSHMQAGNRFWKPGRMAAALDDFERISDFLQYRSYADYRQAQAELGEVPAWHSRGLISMKQAYYALVSRLGPYSFYCLPNLASIWRRRAIN